MPSWWNPRKLGRLVRFGLTDNGDGTYAIKTTSAATVVTSTVPAPIYATRSDTFTGTTSGTTVNLMTTAKGPCKYFTLVVNQTGVVTAWTVLLELSMDGTNWITGVTHTQVIGPGVPVPIVTPTPSLYARTRCSVFTIGLGTNVIATLLAQE